MATPGPSIRATFSIEVPLMVTRYSPATSVCLPTVKSKGSDTRIAPVWAKAEVSRTKNANATEIMTLELFITPPGAVLRKFSCWPDSGSVRQKQQCTRDDSGDEL